MTRSLAILLVVMAGCVSGPSGTASRIDPGLAASIACEGARAVIAVRKAKPPSPATPAGVCQRCGGKGYVGDTASIRIKCDACKGTGKPTCVSGTCGVTR